MATDRSGRTRRWLAGGLVAGAALAVVQAPAASAAPGAATPVTASALTASVQFSGHGYGHGRGMGQWGAYGYATTGASYRDILGLYYGGTTLGTQGNAPITVALSGQDGADLVVTSGREFTAGGVVLPAGTAARLTALPDGTFTLATSAGCAVPSGAPTPVPNSRVWGNVAPGNDVTAMLSLCTNNGTKQYRGELGVVWAGGAEHTVNTVWMEDYLRGVVPRESPASWGDAAGGKGIEALKTQAVAARSYAWAEGRSSYAKTCDTTACQVYGGAGTNGAPIEDRRTDAAVLATADQVLKNAKGAVVRTEFSSSTGGWTAGGTFPAVQDAGDSASPYHDWTTSVSATTIGSVFGVGEFTGMTVLKRNGLGADGGRVTSVQVSGTAKTVTVTGNDVRTKLGLRSDWFSVGKTVAVPPAVVQPYVHEASGNVVGATPTSLPFGQVGDVPLACDWDGNGTATLGVFRAGVFYTTDAPGGPVTAFAYGQAGDQPVCGDWDGNGTETVGVYRGDMVYLRNSNTTGVADGHYAFGAPGDRLVAGDWNGDGFDTVGVWRNGQYFMTNSNIWPTTDVSVYFGDPTDAPVVGDWDGNGTDTIGVFRDGMFYLRDGNDVGPAEMTVAFGDAADKPLAGRWSSGPGDVVGVARGY